MDEQTFVYGMRSRPPMYGTCPPGFKMWDEGDDRCRHGYIAYEYKLSPEEVEAYELLPASANTYEFEIGDKVLVNDIDQADITAFLEAGRIQVLYTFEGGFYNDVDWRDITS